MSPTWTESKSFENVSSLKKCGGFVEKCGGWDPHPTLPAKTL